MRLRVLTALVCTAALAAFAAAADEVILVKYDRDKKVVTVKQADGEKMFKLSDKTRFTFTDQDGKETVGDLAAAEKTFRNEKAMGRAKFDITLDKDNKDTIAAVQFKGRKKN